MMIKRIVVILLTLTTLYSSGQGLTSDSHKREKRQNVAELLQHILRHPGMNPSISDYNLLSQMFPKLSSTDGQLTVNVNHPESKPTTIIHNHADPRTNPFCPCERYLRLAMDSEPVCICPRQQILAKCEENSACVPKYECNNGFMTSRETYTNNEKDKPIFCDEATHVCCTPQIFSTESNKPNQIYNHIVNSTVEKLNNSVNKYIITGNVYLDTGNPSTFVTTDSSDQFKFTVKNKKPQIATTSPAPIPVVEEASKLYVSDIPTTFRPPIEEYTSRPRTTLGLIRPTRPSIGVDANIKPDSRFTSAITSKPVDNRQNIPNPVTTETSNFNQRPDAESLTDEAIASIFEQRPFVRPNELTFPGLPTTSTAITTTELPISSNLIQNVFDPNLNTNLNLLETSTKKAFFSAKVEQLRNNTKQNATTGFQQKMTTSVGQRVWRVEANIPTNNLLFNGKVMRESTTNFQQFVPPSMSANTFVSTESNTDVPLKSSSTGPGVKQSSNIGNCPGRLKCVQTIFCSADGLISTVPVVLSEEDQKRREMLLECGNRQTGQIGKCCMDFN